jgi:hypothetical protein
LRSLNTLRRLEPEASGGRTCCRLYHHKPATPAFSDTYQWSNGTSSTVAYTAPVETVANGNVIVTDTGTVTSGLDQGAVANETTTLPQPNLAACAGTGVSQPNGPYVLTFG